MMTKFGYRRAKGPEATIHAIVSEEDRRTMEEIAAEREMPIGRVAGEAIKRYCSAHVDNRAQEQLTKLES